MLTKIGLTIGALGLSGFLAVQKADEPLASGRYKVDPVHSTVLFKIRHVGVGNFYGRFDKVSGKAALDGSAADQCMFSVTIDASSVDTNNADRDNHLRSPDFFDAKQFPEMTFESSSVKAKKDGHLEVEGTLTFRGVEKDLTVPFEHIGHGNAGGQFGYRAGYEAKFSIKRSEFDNDFMVGPLGDDVEVIVSLEMVKE